MEIRLNGEFRVVADGVTLQAFVESLGIDPQRLAVELDGVIVRRANWPETAVRPGAQIEVVHFVGGG